MPVRGRPLIDYIVTEAYHHGVRRLCVVVDPNDHELEMYLTGDGRFDELTILHQDGHGSKSAVTALVETIGDEDFFLSTCDVIGPTGILNALERSLKAARLSLDPLIVFLATTWVHDEKPIWIDADQDGVISRYGKQTQPASLVFGNVRLCTGQLKRVLSELPTVQIDTDTELMSTILTLHPGRFIAAPVSGRIFDVDDPADLRLAESPTTAEGRPAYHDD